MRIADLRVAHVAALIVTINPNAYASPRWEAKINSDSIFMVEAREAIQDLIHNYWVGTEVSGHLNYACPLVNGCIWEGAQAEMVLYSWWKITGSVDAAHRINSHWKWIRASHPSADLTTCGMRSSENYASDDTAWNVSLMLHAYEVTHDKYALSVAKGALDCARGRWWDHSFGGGFWYDDRRTRKTLYQALLVLDELTVYKLSRSKIYLSYAIEDEEWIASHLMVSYSNNLVTPVGNGLYFNDYTRLGCEGKPGPTGCAYHMLKSKLSQTQTMLVGNMTMCIIDWELYKMTGQKKYRTRMADTANAILQVESSPYALTDFESGGVLTDDQDPNVNGYESVNFAVEVVPNLPVIISKPFRETLRKTALVIREMDRSPSGHYSGDWQGPPIGGIWDSHGKKGSATRITITSNAINVVISAATLQ